MPRSNLLCPIKGCGFNSKIGRFYRDWHTNGLQSSILCPKHRVKLVNCGSSKLVPKKGTKERENLIKLFLNYHKL